MSTYGCFSPPSLPFGRSLLLMMSLCFDHIVGVVLRRTWNEVIWVYTMPVVTDMPELQSFRYGPSKCPVDA